MLAMLHTEDGVLGMGGSVGSAIDRLDRIVLDHFFQRRIRLFALRPPGHVGTAVGEQIADRDQGHVGMVLQIERQTELADAIGWSFGGPLGWSTRDRQRFQVFRRVA